MNKDFPYTFTPGGFSSVKKLIGANYKPETESAVLIIGSQYGEIALRVAKEYNTKVIGLESDPELVIYSKMMAQKYSAGNRTDFVYMEADALSFPKDSFDIVIADNVFSMYHRRKVLDGINHILKPGGIFGTLDSYWQKVPVPTYVQNVWESRDNKIPTIDEWKELLKDAGFALEWVKDNSRALDSFYSQFTKDIKQITASKFEGLKHYKSLVKHYKHEIDVYSRQGGNKFMGHILLRARKPD